MRGTLTICAALLVSLGLGACRKAAESGAEQPPEAKVAKESQAPESIAIQARMVEAGCGSCTYDMPDAEGCVLAVKIDDQPYLVEGADVSAHDAGLCSNARQARVSGKIEGGKFLADSFELQPEEP